MQVFDIQTNRAVLISVVLKLEGWIAILTKEIDFFSKKIKGDARVELITASLVNQMNTVSGIMEQLIADVLAIPKNIGDKEAA